MKTRFWNALVVGSSILAGVFAGRLSDVAQRKGFSKRLVEDIERQKLDARAAKASDLRFYNNETKKYFVESLPEIPQDFMTEMYSGLIPVKDNASRALFFVWQPTVGKPVDEVTIWLNGGPGCSSLEGFFQENGRIIWTWGQFAPTINPYSWVNLTNMLWVEQPVGTGFSIGDVTATSEEDIAADFVSFFSNFQTIFGIKNFKIYITGESYAGRYVPYIANAMLDQKDTTHFNVSGILTYDPCIGEYVTVQQQIPALPFVQQNNNVLGLNKSYLSTLENLDKSCGYAKYREEFLTFPPNKTQPPLYFNSTSNPDCDLWGSVYDASYAPNPCFNVYEIGSQCPLLGDPLGYPTDLQYSYPGTPVYFNRTDVKKAMHAPMEVDWLECAGPVFVGNGGPQGEGDLSPDPIQKVLPRVIEATNRVLVANGDLDLEILTNGTLLAIQNMTWNGKMGFQKAPSTPINIKLRDLEYEAVFTASGFGDIDDPQGVMGIQHYERGLLWAETYLSGHMEPQFQPSSASINVRRDIVIFAPAMPTVAVIGAGPQGLVTLKNLREEGFDATIFEKRPSVGGVWQYTEYRDETSVLLTTLGNISKYRNCFTDFPVPDDAPVHMNAEQTLDYLHSYATHFGLHEHIQLNTRIQRVVPTPDDKRWEILILRNGKEQTIAFDKVVFCTGNTHTAKVPQIDGTETFRGRILHSQNFKRPKTFFGQVVVVAGLGCTAADIACDLVGHASKIYISHRRGNHVLARWCKGKPLDMFGNRRMGYVRDAFSAVAPQAAQKFLDTAVEKLADSCFDLDPAWNFKPAPSILTHRPLVSDVLVDYLRNGSIRSVAGLKRFVDDHHVELEDGSQLEVDAVVYGTGYTADFSLAPENSPMEPSAPSNVEQRFRVPPLARLYKNIFLPSYPDSIAYLCNWGLGDGIMPIGDLASLAIAQVWKGNFPLPSEEHMNRDIDAHHAWARSMAGQAGTFGEVVQQGPWINWLNEAAGTGINENLGYGLRGWMFWLWQPNFCSLVMTGVDSPHVMRLFDGRRKSWAGAREAIIRVNKDAQMRIKEHQEEKKLR